MYPLERGVYAVGRPVLSRRGRWMAAVLAGGPDAVLSHVSAAMLWGVLPEAGEQNDRVAITVPQGSGRRRPNLDIHRRAGLRAADTTRRHGIPVTTVVCTLVDIAPKLSRSQVERAVSEADRLFLVDSQRLIEELDTYPGRPGVGRLRKILGRHTFRLTDSGLERRFLRLIVDAGLPVPETQRYVNGFKVDFFWPGLGLVVETDGLTYHRTALQQARDRRRDQAHTAAGLTQLRFSHAQVCSETAYVIEVLRGTVRRLSRASGA